MEKLFQVWSEWFLINILNISLYLIFLKVQLPVKMDGSPVIVQNVKTNNGTFDLLLVTSTAGHIQFIKDLNKMKIIIS